MHCDRLNGWQATANWLTTPEGGSAGPQPAVAGAGASPCAAARWMRGLLGGKRSARWGGWFGRRSGWAGRLLLLLPGLLLQSFAAAENAGELTNAPPAEASPWNATYGVGAWIWDSQTLNRQECRLWRLLVIPASATVERARWRITADNEYRAFLDGREIGHGADLRMLATYDVTSLLEPGEHVLGVLAYNDLDIAGVLLGLRVELSDGRVLELGSDAGWRVVPENARGWLKKTRAPRSWRPAQVISAVGPGRWPTHFNQYTPPPLQVRRVSLWDTGWFQLTVASVCVVAILSCLYLLGRLVMQSQAQQVVARERARIARDLHDELTGGLTKLVLLGETTQSELPPGSEAHHRLDEMCDRARVLLRGLNETIWLVNSQRDTLRDFASYVCKQAETFLQSTPIRCRFDVEPELPALPCDVGIRRNLFLGIKEALNNVVRHSQASEVFVRIGREGGQVLVAIEDNGRGFDPATADRERNGLQNMAQRAAEAGGECRLQSAPGAGCQVRFRVPLAGPRRFSFPALGRRRAGRPPWRPGPGAPSPGRAATSTKGVP